MEAAIVTEVEKDVVEKCRAVVAAADAYVKARADALVQRRQLYIAAEEGAIDRKVAHELRDRLDRATREAADALRR